MKDIAFAITLLGIIVALQNVIIVIGLNAIRRAIEELKDKP